jgi:Ca2+-binding EF-hand superfamily protein
MFDSFDTDRNGRIDATELVNALEHYRYARLSNHLIFFH